MVSRAYGFLGMGLGMESQRSSQIRRDGRIDRPDKCYRRLTIGIDARALLRKERTGIERMAFHFMENLAQTVQGHEYVLFVDKALDGNVCSQWPYPIVVEPVRFPILQRLCDIWIIYQMRGLIAKYGIDLFFTPFDKFPISSIPCYTTIHGMEWYFCPSDYRLLERIKQWVWFQLSIQFSTGIVTFTKNTRDDIWKVRSHSRIPICVVPEGVDSKFRPLNQGELSPQILDRLQLRAPFILSVCSLEPRKNLDALIRAFAIVVNRHQVPHHLVLVGKAGWKAERLHLLAASLGIEERVCFAGYIPDEEVVQLYNQAALFVYPSKYEGFGLPLLESMACGLPVVTSIRGALAEVAGDAAILVDPFSDTDLAAGILRGLSDESLRASLILSGLERVSQFSWAEMTRRICEFITSDMSDGYFSKKVLRDET